jgi:hypothetical protein
MSPSDLLVIGDRKRGTCPFLNQDNVAAALTRHLPAELFKYTNDFASAEEGDLRHLDRDFDLGGFEGERHAARGANLEAKSDRFLDVLHRFFAGLPLADATGNSRAFDDPHSVFVLIDDCRKLHALQRITM